MRRLIVSDIHGNLEGLEAVLAHAKGQFDEIVCCGDLVGYGANPTEVIEWARQSVAMIVRGNHDRVCSTLDGIEDFNPIAKSAAHWTHDRLSARDIEWLIQLPQGPLIFDDFQLAHGSPGDEDEYVFHGDQVEHLAASMLRPICFVGHTHVQGGWSWERGGVVPMARPSARETERIISLVPHDFYLVNPGSVGQPRDGDTRAGYAIWDTQSRLLSLRRTYYDVARAQDRMMVEGLPPYLAARLAVGR